ncbi:MAG: M42 family metallopeptidase, partial [Chloroflexota bacterium]
MIDLIKTLTELYGPSGYEQAIRQAIQAEITPHVDEVTVDALGNLHALKKGTDSSHTIMLAAHMDEIGLMVTKIEKEGFARFTNLGGLQPLNLAGSRVIFNNGVIGTINVEDSLYRPNIKAGLANLFIDFGVSKREDVPVQVGDVAAFYGPCIEVNNRIMSKSLDDRIGCVVQIETLKQVQTPPHDIHFVFTVQEEVGVRGATAGAFRVDPTIAIAIDVTPSGDTPGDKPFTVSLGQGAAIKIMDRGSLSHPAIKDWMIDTAEANDIAYQLEVLTAGGTDARAMQLAKAGSAAGCVSIPCRHVHA